MKAHILVCFLAYVLWKTLAGWMRNAGLGDAPRTVIESFVADQKWRRDASRPPPERRTGTADHACVA